MNGSELYVHSSFYMGIKEPFIQNNLETIRTNKLFPKKKKKFVSNTSCIFLKNISVIGMAQNMCLRFWNSCIWLKKLNGLAFVDSIMHPVQWERNRSIQSYTSANSNLIQVSLQIESNIGSIFQIQICHNAN